MDEEQKDEQHLQQRAEEQVEERVEEPTETYEEPVKQYTEEPVKQYTEEPTKPAEPKKRGRPRLTDEQKRLRVVEGRKPPEPKVVERVIERIIEVPVEQPVKTPMETLGHALKQQAMSDYERRRAQWASFKFV